MPRGTVKWFDEKKGYGFIEEDDGGQVFLQCGTMLFRDIKRLRQGQRVAFDIRSGGKEPVAENVKPL